MTFGRTYRAFDNREVGHPRRRDVGGRLDQHGDVEMILEQTARLDRLLVAAVDQGHAFAFEADERNHGCGLARGSKQRRDLRACGACVLRPARGLADIGVGDVRAFGCFGEQRRLLRAADDQRRVAGGRRAELLQLGAAELAAGQDLGAATAALDRRAVERHRVLTRADQNGCWPIGHLLSGLA